MPCDELDPGYGWIVPGEPLSTLATAVWGLHHDVGPGLAGRLRGRGGLLDSRVVAGTTTALIKSYARAAPALLSAFHSALGSQVHPPFARLRFLYAGLAEQDLSRDVLGRMADGLAVVRGRRCGWTDLDTSERLALHGRARARRQPEAALVR